MFYTVEAERMTVFRLDNASKSFGFPGPSGTDYIGTVYDCVN